MAHPAENHRTERDASSVPWADLTLQGVLRLQGLIVDELRDRQVIRTRNVVGELGETLVRHAYDGTLGAPSQTGWDVLAGGRKLQVKVRIVEEGEKRTQQFTPFSVNEVEADTADAFVFIVLHATTYEVVWALEIPRDDVWALSRHVPNSTKRRVNIRQVRGCSSAVDVTESLVRSYAELNTTRQMSRSARRPRSC